MRYLLDQAKPVSNIMNEKTKPKNAKYIEGKVKSLDRFL